MRSSLSPALLLVWSLLGGVAAAGPTIIEGSVVTVAHDELTIEYRGEWAPRLGDPATVGFLLDGEFIAGAGDWRVTHVDAERVRVAGAGGSTTGIAYLARIQASDPQRRSSLAALPDPGSPSPEELFQRGLQCADGIGVARDRAAAVGWFRQAAELGHVAGQQKIGKAYQLGDGVEKDLPAALAWFEKAAAQGLAEAQNEVGFMLAQGMGAPQDELRALEFFRAAAAQGFAAGISNIGAMYERGMGNLPQDFARAAAYYLVASEMGYALATRNLGMLYESGMGVPKSREKAVELLQDAARQSNSQAQSWLKEHGYSW